MGVFTVDAKGRITSASNVAISTSGLSNGTSNISIYNNGNITLSVGGVANVEVVTSTGVNVAGTFDATGNITGGNISTAGLIVATGNVTGGNLITGGLASVTGNVTGGNLITGGLASIGTTLSVTGNANVGNLSTAGLITATGNVTGGNLVTAGLASVTGNITGGNINTAGQVVATGNVAGGNLIADNLTSTRIPYVGANKQLTDSTNFTWDNANQVANIGAGGTQLGGDAGFGFLSTKTVTATGNVDTVTFFWQAGAVEAAGEVGTITDVSVSVALSGVEGFGLVEAESPDVTRVLTGVAATGAVETITMGQRLVAITGCQAMGQVGDIGLRFWSLIDTAEDAGWTNITTQAA